jgi:predicted negative regulator of RcsB-dependent stress response
MIVEKKNDKYVTNEEAQASVRLIAAIILAVGLVAGYWVWPTGITDLTLASITFGTLLRAIAAGVIVVGSLVFTAMLWN